MAQVKTDEEMGQEVLELYAAENLRPGEMLQAQFINVQLQSAGERVDDIMRGVTWLIDNNLLEAKDCDSSVLFLTDQGFERM